MESRIIYESDKTYLNRIIWTKPKENSESEWCYLNPEGLREEDIEKILEENFEGEKVYLATNRNESIEVNKAEVASKIKSLYGKSDFRIWNNEFESVVEFKTEVYRKGKASH